MGKSKSVDCTANKIYGTVISGLLCASLVVSEEAVYPSVITKPETPYVTSYNNQTNIVTSCGIANSTIGTIFNTYNSSTEQKFTMQIDDEKMSNLKRLENISELSNNWNENGAISFSSAIISKARMILTMLEIQPEIFPIASGDIQLEYDGPQGSYLEFEINESKASQVYEIDREGKEKYLTIDSEADAINKLVNAFYE